MLSVGKRYTCSTCGTQVLVTKPGSDAEVTCCGAPISAEEPKKVASSD